MVFLDHSDDSSTKNETVAKKADGLTVAELTALLKSLPDDSVVYVDDLDWIDSVTLIDDNRVSIATVK